MLCTTHNCSRVFLFCIGCRSFCRDLVSPRLLLRVLLSLFSCCKVDRRSHFAPGSAELQICVYSRALSVKNVHICVSTR